MAFKDIFVYPKYPENLDKLPQLAYNLWCTWNYEAINLFYRIDAELFKSVHHNPVQFLVTLPRTRMDELSKDKVFLFELQKVWDKFQEYMKYGSALKSERTGGPGLTQDDVIAYFAMEFGLHECIPIYGGGLGILSGDFLKAASDLGLPVVGVGLIYKYGYFTQRISLTGQQEELFIEFENRLIPLREVHGPDGQPLYTNITLLKDDVKIKLWEVQVGLTRLILLDTDIVENPPQIRAITQHELYVAEKGKRLQQELVLGLGGIKALESLGIEPRIYHLNEGHSAFLVVARLQKLMTENKLSFSEARAVIRASTVFTTHTPVAAGNENFDIVLVKKYLEPIIKPLNLSFDELSGYGFIPGEEKIFWLPAFAISFSKHVNAVSEMHRTVSRKMWSCLYPQWPVAEIPIHYVTNGVHSSWLSESYTRLLERHIGPDWVHWAEDERVWDKIMNVPDEEIWEAHRKNKQDLIIFMRRKLIDDLSTRGYSTPKIMELTRSLDHECLTLVFARRFAVYKRPTLILKDKERLKNILTNTTRPLQLIFAGKAHPADEAGKKMIKEIIDFARSYGLDNRVIFLENYDINVARHLVWGADVWLNTPIRENEASGTSGMKAAMNGVLNLSVLDGWWPECYNGKNGWAITAGEYYKNPELQEVAEANQIYDLIEAQIRELYYDRNEIGIPAAWVNMMKHSISSACSTFNMNRVVMCYTHLLYEPAKSDCEALCKNDFQAVKGTSAREQEILKYWDNIIITDFSTSGDQKEYLTEGDQLDVHITVDFAGVSPELFSVELFYMLPDRNTFRRIPMQLEEQKKNLAYYGCSLELQQRGLQNINARIMPADPTVRDLHPELIKWKE